MSAMYLYDIVTKLEAGGQGDKSFGATPNVVEDEVGIIIRVAAAVTEVLVLEIVLPIYESEAVVWTLTKPSVPIYRSCYNKFTCIIAPAEIGIGSST